MKAEYALADAEQDLRQMTHWTKASRKLKKQAEITELKAKIEQLRGVVS